jgi:beta-phosphoglucomutase-like phosphatase (HAD superfamily)
LKSSKRRLIEPVVEVARRLGVEPRHCRVYEDTDPGIEAARRAGMEYIDVRELFTPRRVT